MRDELFPRLRKLKLTPNKLKKAVQKLGWREFTAEDIYPKLIPWSIRKLERGSYLRTRYSYNKLIRFLKKMEVLGYIKPMNYPTKGDPQSWRWVSKRERERERREWLELNKEWVKEGYLKREVDGKCL